VVTAVLIATAFAIFPREQPLLIGIYQPNSPGSYNQIDTFASQAGFTPRITSYYTNEFSMPFPTTYADEAASKGTEVLVQWQPRGTTNAAVASGNEDGVIEAMASAVSAAPNQVIISYGQEMNGNWYEWCTAPGGVTDSNPTDYVAAYRHVYDIFQDMGVHNVTWLWDPNVEYAGSTPLSEVYPGDAYVDWVGLDGYYSEPSTTFASLFGPSIATLHQLTSKPLLIGEFGVTGAGGAGQIAETFAGAWMAGAAGLVYFDESQSGDSMHQDWRLEDNAANMAAFKAAVQQYGQRPLQLANFP